MNKAALPLVCLLFFSCFYRMPELNNPHDPLNKNYHDENDGTNGTDGFYVPPETDSVIFVDIDAVGTGSGETWADAVTDLQSAIDSADSGDEIWVAAGTYHPQSYPNGGITSRYRHFSLKNNVAVFGGFTGTEIERQQRDFRVNGTTLSGDFNNDDVISGYGEGLSVTNIDENAFHVIYHPSSHWVNETAFLDGFTATGGAAIDGPPLPHDHGGGICVTNSETVIVNCTVTQNYTSVDGGGMHIRGNSHPVLYGCVFFGNSASDGGGICNHDSGTETTIVNSELGTKLK